MEANSDDHTTKRKEFQVEYKEKIVETMIWGSNGLSYVNFFF